MSRLRRCALRLYNVIRPGRAQADADREMTSHLTLLEDDLRSRGFGRDESRLAARRAFGGVAQARELHRDARSFVWLADAGRDLRHGARVLRRTPLFTLTAAISLAIGLGATATIAALANALFFRPPAGVADSGRLVDIGSNRGRGGFGPSSYPNYLDIRQRTTALASPYASSRFPQSMSLADTAAGIRAETVFGTLVTTNYFTGLGVVPAAGRLFDAGDSEQPGASPIAVLSYRFWTRRFNQDPGISGRRLTLGGVPFTIVGVASEGFQGTGIRSSDVWVPMGMAAAVTSQGMAALTNRGAAWLSIGGRLKPGVGLSRAAAEMDVLGRALEHEYPDQNRDTGLRLLPSSPIPGNNGPLVAFLVLLASIVCLVLAVASANVAGVLLARATARRQEIAVRLTMGAGRGRLVRQLLTETVLLFVLGGAAGLWLASGATSLLSSYLAASSFAVDVPLVLDVRVVAFAAGLTLVAALLSGLAPALQGTRADVASALKDDGQAPARLRLRHLFLGAQVAFSLLLVVMAGLCARALQHAGSVDLGFDPHGVELASIDLSQAYTSATGPRFARELIDRVRRLPDVGSATVAAVLPGGFETRRQALTVPGASPPNGQRFFGVDWNVVEPDYFSTLRIPLLAGRDFRPADRDGATPVAIVSEGAATQFWPGLATRDAIGKYLVEPVFGPAGPTGESRTLLVVGVVHEVKSTSVIDGLARACVYVPLQQAYTPALTLAARTTRGQRVTNELRSLLASMNPNLPIVTAQTLDESLAFGLTPQRVVAWVSGGLGVVGLLLAGLGIYGVTAYVVTRRTREIGIRMALGAPRATVVRMVLQQGMAPVVVGSAVGLMLAAASARILTAYLFGIPPIDPVTFSGVAALFLSIALAACYTPVRRATRVDAMDALRHE